MHVSEYPALGCQHEGPNHIKKIVPFVSATVVEGFSCVAYDFGCLNA